MAKYQSGFALAVLAATLVAGHGANDWSKPCFNGECAYDIPTESQSASIKMGGSCLTATRMRYPRRSALCVTRTARGRWLQVCVGIGVCARSHIANHRYSHLFEGEGPVHKYVRLPESVSPSVSALSYNRVTSNAQCGSEPFARIADYRVHENQSIPEHAASKISRRDGVAPQVFSVSIDDDFARVDETKYGKVFALVAGTNLPGVDTNFAIPQEIDNKDVADKWAQQAMDDIAVKGLKATLSTYYVTKPDGEVEVKKSKSGEELDAPKKSGKFEWGSKTSPFTVPVKREKELASCGPAALKAELKGSLATKAYGSAAAFSAAAVIELSLSSIRALASNILGEINGEIKKEFTLMEDTAVPHAGIDLKCVNACSSELSLMRDWCLHDRYVAAGLLFGISGEMSAKAQVGVEIKTGFKWGVDKGSSMCFIGSHCVSSVALAVIAIPGSRAATPYSKDGYFEFGISKDGDGNKATGEIDITLHPKFSLGINGKDKLKNIKASANIGLKAGLGLSVGITGTPKRDLAAASDWYCAKLIAHIEGVAGVDLKHPIKFIPNWDDEFSLFKKELELWTPDSVIFFDSMVIAPHQRQEGAPFMVCWSRGHQIDSQGDTRHIEMSKEGSEQVGEGRIKERTEFISVRASAPCPLRV
ncbi:Acetolactate synthase [Salix suchowensis]|nr:Acetolactate synthase [Salix suchowensis]